MSKKSTWICITGIDGTGKTTLCKYLVQILGKKSKFMKIPYFDWVRDMIKISGNNTPFKDKHTDMLLFSASNRLEMYYIDKFMKEYDYLITQRCWLDNYPYRKTQGISLKESLRFQKPHKFRKPNIIFFLECDHRIAYNRIKDNKKGDKYEKLYFMKTLKSEFEKMFKNIEKETFPIKFTKTKIIKLDATKPLSDLKKEIKEHLITLKHHCSGP